MKSFMPGQCLPRPLVTDADGLVPNCIGIEGTLPGGGTCDCSSPGRKPLSDADAIQSAREDLVAEGACGGQTGVSCAGYCFCEIQQLSGADLQTCRSVLTDPGGIYGFCYVDAENGAPELLVDCPSTQMQIIRLLGAGLPAPGAFTFIGCHG